MQKIFIQEILEILEKDSRKSEEEIAIMLNKSIEEVKEAKKELEDKKVIVGYNAMINWDKVDKDHVTALIEVKITPQRGQGFDHIAQRICRFQEVKTCYLMSGGFDLTVVIEGKTIREVALFVAQKLAPLDSVLSTSTHFVLKRYKDMGTAFEEEYRDDREAVVL